MKHIISGLASVIIVTLFVGGLAVSIWKNTGSIAFPAITAIVLIMIYIDFFYSIRYDSKQ